MAFFSLVLMHIAVLAYALVSGVFLAFSDFIMRSLSRTSGHGGVEAMQVINREVFRWVFMSLFLGMAAGSLFLTIYAAMALDGASGMLIFMSGLIYVLGCFGVTILLNVPMNEALSKMEPASEAAHAYWRRVYLPRWTFWNTVRTMASLLAAALLLLGLVSMDHVS